MSSKRKSGSIQDFFKSKSLSQQISRQPQPDNATPMATAVAKLPTPPSRQTSTPPRLPSLTSTPVKPTRAAHAEIADSDPDDDGSYSSDSDVEELGVLLGLTTNPGPLPKPAPSPKVNGHGIFGTPKAKRTAIEFHSSPITRRPKRTKNGFDFAALARDAAMDKAIMESSAKADLAAEMGLNDDESGSEHDVSESDKGKQRLVKAATEKIGGNDQKLLRALRREQGIEPRYYFFDPDKQLLKASTPPKTNGPWRFLTHGSARAIEQNLISGLPQTLAREHPAPDNLFLWMLEQVTTQSSATTRAEFARIVSISDTQFGRLVTPQILTDIFARLGAADDLQDEQHVLPTLKPDEDPYARRDWSCLYAVLSLLAGTSGSEDLGSAAAQHAAKILLRLSLDSVILDHADLLTKFEEAMARVLAGISAQEWDLFCFTCCSMVLTIMKFPGIRINALLCLPISSPRALDLRRRLATGFLFSDAKLARVQASESITLKDLITRINAEDFTVNRNTDFVQLESKAVLLDMVVNDGTFGPVRNQSDEKEFNEAIDVLVDKLKETWGSISDVGLDLSRTHAKTTIEWVRQRLMYAVRTKKRPMRDIYALAGYGAQTDPFNVSKQREYMSSFLKKGAPPKA